MNKGINELFITKKSGIFLDQWYPKDDKFWLALSVQFLYAEWKLVKLKI